MIGFIEKMVFEQRFKRGEKVSHVALQKSFSTLPGEAWLTSPKNSKEGSVTIERRVWGK